MKIKKCITKVACLMSVLTVVSFPIIAAAQPGGVDPEQPPTEINIPEIVDRIIGWAFALLLTLAAVFIIFAAFNYLTSAGDEDKVKKAKNYLIYAIVAIVIGFAARGIIAIVKSLLTG